MMLKDRSFHILAILAVAFALAFGLPQTKYKSTDVLQQLHVPMAFAGWSGHDYDSGQKLMDERYNFMNALFLREYANPEGRKVFLFLLDAGNFHNPKVCLTAVGFKMRELDDTALAFRTRARGKDAPFSGTSIYISKEKAGVLVTYWMVINGRRVNWVEQKAVELWCSLLGIRKAGLMVRIDIPTNEADLPHARELLKSFTASLDEAITSNERWFIFGR